MLSKKFYINIITRVLLITCTIIGTIPFILKDEKLFTLIALSSFIIIQILLLIKYINRFNREISSFFSLLKTSDASFAFNDKSFSYISEKVRDDIFQVQNQLFDITELKEIQKSYLETVIESAQTGIITITETGNIDLINKYATELLNINLISNLKALEKLHPNFYHTILNGVAGSEKLIMIKGKSKAIPLSIRISEFKQKQNMFKLVSFQNIQSELEEKEVDSWHKLIRVLTHEINNTVSPITSLANSIEKLYINKSNDTISKKEISDKIIETTHEGLHIISQRGEGLMEFVNNYRNISSLKKMNFERFKVAELFYNLELLMKKNLSEKNIKLSIEVKPIDLELNADKKYIEQIFINLLKNSIDAINSKSGKITLKAFKNEDDKIILEITDNGIGISEEIRDQIFVPFFTTKEQGSGIGLSLAQQIMRLHGGSISVQSLSEGKTSFVLSF
ncbi:MAG: hypothetical protein KOO66_06090 [Bacteroidales bacterium]|nr:hypothetical protein [Bacteroidales bacterium]